MLLTEEEPTVEEENDIDFNEGLYDVLQPEDRYSCSSESRVDNNEKPRKTKKGKRKAPKLTMKTKRPASKKIKTDDVQWTNEENIRTFAPFSPILGPTFRKITLPRGGNDSKPIDFFSLYFTDEVLEFLAYETNCSAEQC